MSTTQNKIPQLPPMTRGLGQVLFNYLPEATLDYDKGSCICKVAEVRINTEAAKSLDHRRILSDVRQYIKRWGNRCELPANRTFNIKLFAIGEPVQVLFNVYPLVFECRKCRAAFSYKNEHEFVKNPRNHKCRWCGGRLGQIYHILVHECGEMKQLWVPSCRNKIHRGKQTKVVLDFRSSQKAMDFSWVCRDCGQPIKPIIRQCRKCHEEAEKGVGEERENLQSGSKSMRPIPHRANAAYYTHHLTRVNVSREDVRELEEHPDKERILVEAYLNGHFSSEDLLHGITSSEDGFSESVRQCQRAQGLPDGPEKDILMKAAKVLEALEAKETKNKKSPRSYGVTEQGVEQLFDYVKLRGTCQTTDLERIQDRVEKKRPGRGRIYRKIRKEYENAGVCEIGLIEDFPIATYVFGYTRVSPDPETKMGKRVIRTTFRHFPTFRMSTESLQDRIPIFTRVSETEGLFVRLEPLKVLDWLNNVSPGIVDNSNMIEKDAQLWLLCNIGEVDRFVTRDGMSETTQLIFGLIHTMSHIFIRAAASLAGVDRTGFGEYLFPKIGAFVVYNAKTEFNLGGLTTLFEEELDILLRKARYDPLAKECIYDPVCREHRDSSCHACTHLGEMACAYFNRCMSRELLFGQKGFWGV